MVGLLAAHIIADSRNLRNPNKRRTRPSFGGNPYYKTLSEVEPRIAINATNTPPGATASLFQITSPGSYYLTGNVTGVSSKYGIVVSASNVTIDLNGFNLNGVPGSLYGITYTGTVSGTRVTNGTVSNWGALGVSLGDRCQVSAVRAVGNGSAGIVVGDGSVVHDCVASGNGAGGFDLSAKSVATASVASGNTGVGFRLDAGGRVSDCTASNNTSDGFWLPDVGAVVSNCNANQNNLVGINAAAGTTVEGCSALLNGADGILVTSGCVVRNNHARSNGALGNGSGIHATGADNRVEGNHCGSNDVGYNVDIAGNLIIRNTEAGNTNGWIIAANNQYGPVIDRRSSSTLFVNGFGQPANSVGSTDPHANFSY